MNHLPWLAFLVVFHSAFAADLLDPTFRPHARPILGGPDGPVLAMAQGPGDSVMIAGDFLRVSGIYCPTLARLRVDGTLDPFFRPGSGAVGLIRSILVDSDGSMLVAGEFSDWNGTSVTEPLIQLRGDGSIDEQFTPVASGVQRVQQLVRLPGGAFLAWGQETNTGTSRTFIQRRLPSGAIDSTFQPILPESVVIHDVAAGDDGAVWIAGKFTEILGANRTNLVRLTPTLEVDLTWECPVASVTTELRAVALGSDGRIAIGGSISQPFPEGYLAVLHPNGQPDPTFSTTARFNERVERVAFDTGGGIAVTSRFTALGWTDQHWLSSSGADRRINASGPVDGAQPLAVPDGRVLWPLNGVSLVGGNVRSGLWRSLPDGSLDTSLFPAAKLDPEIPYSGHVMTVLPTGEVVTLGRSGLETNSVTGAKVFLQHLVRLDQGGAAVDGFDPHVSGGTGIEVLEATAESGVLVAGSFNRINWDTASPMLSFLRKDGSRDNTFDSRMRSTPFPENWWVGQARIQADGGVVLGGQFSLGSPGFSNPVLFHRLLVDGNPDPQFKPISATTGGINRFLPLESDRFLLWGQVNDAPRTLFVYSATGTSNAAPTVTRMDGPPAIHSLVRTADGGVLLAGQFDAVGGLPRAGLARLRSDLTVDPDFAPVRDINGAIHCVAELQDGRILVGGAFTQWNGKPSRRLMLLDAQGQPDPGWSLGTGPDDGVYALRELGHGQVLIGGLFGSIDGSGPSRLARINLPPAAPVPPRLMRQPQSRIVTQVAGKEVVEAAIQGTPPLEIRWYRNGVLVPVSGGIVEPGVARLVLSPSDLAEPATYHVEVANLFGRERSVGVVVGLASGTLDPAFTTNQVSGLIRLKETAGTPVAVTGMYAFRDAAGRAQRILLVGNFTQYDGEPFPGLVLIRPDGTRDPTWNPPAGLTGATVAAAQFLPDRSVYLTGKFTRANGAPRDVVVRLTPDGAVDESFDPGDELTVSPPPGFPRQNSAVSLASDGNGVFFASPAGANLPNGFVRRLDGTGRTDLNFRATNAVLYGSPTVLALETEPGGGLLIGGSAFGATRRTASTPLFRGVARFLLDGKLDLTFNDAPRRPDSSAAGDVTAILPQGTHLWVGGNFAEFDRASGPWVRLDSQGIADTNFAIRFSGTTQVYPRRALRSVGVLPSGGFLMNFQVSTPASDSVQRLTESGEIEGTSGGAADRMRLPTGPVLAIDEHSYLVSITLRETLPFGGLGAAYQSLGRFSLNGISASYTNVTPPRIVGGLVPITLTNRPGFREPLVLSAVVQADPAALYRWYHGELLIPEATGPTWTIDNPQPSDSGEYRLEVASAAGVSWTSTWVTIVNAPANLPWLSTDWVSGERPLRIRFTPVAGQNVRWEASRDLNTWLPVTDPAAFVTDGELAPAVDTGPNYFRIVESP